MGKLMTDSDRRVITRLLEQIKKDAAEKGFSGVVKSADDLIKVVENKEVL